ncbi:hypothetical protein predicted by Glimmer/Critica [Sorangium cellulosum So ce56]|uniref:Uncharacterized protein n=1 Tax=Sorangium cellulosum (strain So ce56) TaxID=448385 RepID=A9GIL8_SORC5|nr:hypothetical protein predicted by Glimmer/Critica [Sorangium cellulosum So ce56]
MVSLVTDPDPARAQSRFRGHYHSRASIITSIDVSRDREEKRHELLTCFASRALHGGHGWLV